MILPEPGARFAVPREAEVNDMGMTSKEFLGKIAPEIACRVRGDILDSIAGYVCDGIPLGDFLQAVAANDLREALGRADMFNRAALFEIVQVFYNYAPAECWGERDNYKDWVLQGGINRVHEKEQG